MTLPALSLSANESFDSGVTSSISDDTCVYRIDDFPDLVHSDIALANSQEDISPGDVFIDVNDEGEIVVFTKMSSVGYYGRGDIETNGKVKVTLAALKKLLKDYWHKIPILKKYDISQTLLMRGLDKYFSIYDTIENVLDNAIRDVNPNLPNWVVVSIRKAILLAIPVL